MTTKTAPTSIPELFQVVGNWVGKKAKEFKDGFAEGRASARPSQQQAPQESGPRVV